MPESFKKDIKQNNIKVTTKLILSHIFSGDSLKKIMSEMMGWFLVLMEAFTILIK